MIVKTGQAITNAFIIKAIGESEAANIRLHRLQNYYKGKQDILQRIQADPHKPNNKIVVNYCQFIADFLTAYLVGMGVEYKNAPPKLIELLEYNDTDEVTQELVNSMNVTGYGAEIHYIDSQGIPRFTSIDPTECIVILDDTLEANLRALIRYYPTVNGDYKRFNVTLYTAETITQYTLNEALSQLTQQGKPTPHYYKDVPFIFYPNNKDLQGSFEQVISLQNALNTLVSDEINDFESFVDSYLVLKGLAGTKQEDIAQMKQSRVLLLDGECAAEWLTKNVNNEHIKQLKKDLEMQIQTLGRVPDNEMLKNASNSGIALKIKLINTETQASRQQRIVSKGIQRRLELLYNVLTTTGEIQGKYTDIELVFTRIITPQEAEGTAPVEVTS